jgi:hypothetical protein
VLTVIFMAPLPVFEGTATVIVVLLTLNTLALTDPKLTLAPKGELNPVPVIVTILPATPDVGENEVMVGVVTVNVPGAVIVCPPITAEIFTAPALVPYGTAAVSVFDDDA